MFCLQDIDAQLRLSAASFLCSEDGCQVDLSKKLISLSAIFKWYKEDFGSNNKEVVSFAHFIDADCLNSYTF